MDQEIDIHVWCKQGDDTVAPLYTISVGKRGIVIDGTLSQAVDGIQDLLDDMAEVE